MYGTGIAYRAVGTLLRYRATPYQALIWRMVLPGSEGPISLPQDLAVGSYGSPTRCPYGHSVRISYTTSGTDAAYAGTPARSPVLTDPARYYQVSEFVREGPEPVQTLPTGLRARYAVSGTDKVHAERCYQSSSVERGASGRGEGCGLRDVRYWPSESCYPPTHSLCDVRYWPSVARYRPDTRYPAEPRTEIAYGGTKTGAEKHYLDSIAGIGDSVAGTVRHAFRYHRPTAIVCMLLPQPSSVCTASYFPTRFLWIMAILVPFFRTARVLPGTDLALIMAQRPIRAAPMAAAGALSAYAPATPCPMCRAYVVRYCGTRVGYDAMRTVCTDAGRVRYSGGVTGSSGLPRYARAPTDKVTYTF
eukprot:3940311-Rhodomonas_salina.8